MILLCIHVFKQLIGSYLLFYTLLTKEISKRIFIVIELLISAMDEEEKLPYEAC